MGCGPSLPKVPHKKPFLAIKSALLNMGHMGDVLNNCEEVILKRIIAAMEGLIIKKGEYLVSIGEKPSALFIVYSGAFTMAMDDKIVSGLVPGDCVGEICFMRDGPSLVTVKATVPSIVYKLTIGGFESIAGKLKECLTRSRMSRISFSIQRSQLLPMSTFEHSVIDDNVFDLTTMEAKGTRIEQPCSIGDALDVIVSPVDILFQTFAMTEKSMSNGSWNISGKSIGPFPDELRGLLWDTLGPAVSTSTIGATFINLAPSARSITVREDEWKANFEGLWNRADQDGLYDLLVFQCIVPILAEASVKTSHSFSIDFSEESYATVVMETIHTPVSLSPVVYVVDATPFEVKVRGRIVYDSMTWDDNSRSLIQRRDDPHSGKTGIVGFSTVVKRCLIDQDTMKSEITITRTSDGATTEANVTYIRGRNWLEFL